MGKGRTDRFVANVGEIVVVIDYGFPEFFIELPEQTLVRELVRVYRLLADLGFQLCDFREYHPETVGVGGQVRIELERVACP